MALANKHIHDFESKAEDRGTPSRNTKFCIQRCLNQHCLNVEAALLSMPVILWSNNFALVDPCYTIAYMEHKMHSADNSSALED
jgi:hypothetical protein